MPGFLYFIETDKNELTHEDLRAAGLGHLVDGPRAGKPLGRGCRGPEGKGGVVFAVGDGVPKYQPDKQTWRAGPARWVGGVKAVPFWVGFRTEAPPKPADLARATTIAGEDVELADGNTWTVPVCFSIVRGSTFPKTLVLGDDCETWQELERPEFHKLCGEAERVWQAFLSAEQTDTGGVRVELDKQFSANVCVDALAVNYRVSKLEVSMLGVLGTDSQWKVLRAIVDDYTVERVGRDLQKKSDPPDGSPSADGVTGSSPATSPPSPT